VPLDCRQDTMAAQCCRRPTSLRLANATASILPSKDSAMSLFRLQTPIARGAQLATILGLATAAPEHSIAQSDAAIVAQQLMLSKRWHDALPALYRKSGVKRRGSVLLGPEGVPDLDRQSFYKPADSLHPSGPSTAARMQVFAERAGPLLVRACAAAIENAGIVASSVTHLVTVSCTGFFAPGVDIALMEALKLDTNIQRTHVGFMGCHGALNAIRVAKSIVESDPKAVVLLGAIELCSLHQQYTDDAQQLVANALFADGAAGLIIGASPSSAADGELDSGDASELSGTPWEIVSTLSKWIPGTTGMMSWTIGDHGFRMSLDPQVPSVIEANLENELARWLELESLRVSDVGAWAIHPGGPRIVQATGSALGLPAEFLLPSQGVLAEHGNMSSPTVLFILERLSQQPLSANICVLLAFGPGLCIEAVLLRRG